MNFSTNFPDVYDIVILPDLLSETKCCQTLLLCAAALANASLPRMSNFNENAQVMSPNSVAVTESLAWCEAATELLKAVKRRGPGCSVFLQVSDQKIDSIG